MKTVPFNLNNYVRVKINEKGFVHWMNEWNKYMPDNLKQDLSFFTSQEKEDGYCEFQAHSFIELFGSTIKMGNPPLFDINILIQVSAYDN